MSTYLFSYDDTLEDIEQNTIISKLEEQNRFIESVNQNITKLTIKLIVNNTSLELLKRELHSLARSLATNASFAQLYNLTFDITVGLESAEEDYTIDSSFPELVINLLKAIQNPSNLCCLTLKFDFPFNMSRTNTVRTEQFNSVIEQFINLNYFSIEGYMITASIPDVSRWIANHSNLSSVRLHMPQGCGNFDFSYLHQVLTNKKIRCLSIVHSTPHQCDLAGFDQWIKNIVSLSIIQNSLTLRQLHFDFNLSELSFNLIDSIRHRWKKAIGYFLASCFRNPVLKSLNLSFSHSAYDSLESLSPKWLDHSLQTILKKNTSLEVLTLSQDLPNNRPLSKQEQFIEEIISRNKKYSARIPFLFGMTQQVNASMCNLADESSVSKYLTQCSVKQLFWFDRVLLDHIVRVMPAIYDMRLWKSIFIKDAQKITILNRYRNFLNNILIQFLILQSSVSFQGSAELIAQLLLPYFTAGDLKILNTMVGGVFVRNYSSLPEKVEPNQTVSQESASAIQRQHTL